MGSTTLASGLGAAGGTAAPVEVIRPDGADEVSSRRLPSALSPSSISTYEQCPRRFQHSRIDRLPDPSGPDAVLGTFVHHVL
ncbi:MAG: PD-(D/E)XK nuclease family protein, partial [Acidimicrobiales bacterium]